MYLIADPVIRGLLAGAVPLLFLVAWWSLRAQIQGRAPLRSLAARLRHVLAASTVRK